MASFIQSLTVLFTYILIARPAFSADSPSPSPALASPSPEPLSIAAPPTDAPSPDSPPAPPPADLSSKSPSPLGDDDGANRERSPSPAPVAEGGVSSAAGLEADDDRSGEMDGGKKAGVAIGVIASGGIVVLGFVVYRKRKQNIRRGRYGLTARREML